MRSTKFYDLTKIPDEINFIMGSSLEKKNIILQQRVHDLQWTVLTAIELLEKENDKKALKVLKKVLYEK